MSVKGVVGSLRIEPVLKPGDGLPGSGVCFCGQGGRLFAGGEQLDVPDRSLVIVTHALGYLYIHHRIIQPVHGQADHYPDHDGIPVGAGFRQLSVDIVPDAERIELADRIRFGGRQVGVCCAPQ